MIHGMVQMRSATRMERRLCARRMKGRCAAFLALACSLPALAGAQMAVGRGPGPAIVIGFVGGHVRANDHVHMEVKLAASLSSREGDAAVVKVFANRDGKRALATVLNLLDSNQDGNLSREEKDAAQIIIYGHSWGAAQTVSLARQLDREQVKVLLTVQVDSVSKWGERGSLIPANVESAVNMYQTRGLLHGHSVIVAEDPARTHVVGNFRYDYSEKPVDCQEFPWYARAFMKPHIEIENDPQLWAKIGDMIVEQIDQHSPRKVATR